MISLKYDLTYSYKTSFEFADRPWQVDVPVLLIFFNRPGKTKLVFESIRKARPSTLFLYQDGPRLGNPSDEEMISRCREIVNSIDWSCTVYHLYQKSNFGCDPSGYISRKWAFSIVEKCIILEDDCVPSISFFGLCKELLDKYEDDRRIYRISGQNILGSYSPYYGDYFFTKGGSIWGWATWKRVIDEWDENYHFLEEPGIIDTIKYTYKKSGVPAKKFLKTCKKHKKTGVEYFESIFSSSRILGSGLTIVPSKNMISNIGLSDDAVHGKANIHLYPKRVQKVFGAELFEICSPIKHPKYILEDKKYEMRQARIMGWNFNIIQKAFAVLDEFIRKLLFAKR